MTRDDVLKLPAGRDLDALIAESVLGWTDVRTALEHKSVIRYGRKPGDPVQDFVPQYSTDIAAAWEVVEKLRAAKWLVTVKHMPDGSPFIIEGSRSEYDAPCPDREVAHGKAGVELLCMDRERIWNRPREAVFRDTVPHAICLAALLATIKEAR